ncbi:MAG: c-type cytochrome [Planctomycetota bacterium]
MILSAPVSVRLSFAAEDAAAPGPRVYAKAALKGGDAARGRKVFESERATCIRCHRVGKDERRAGPDLLGIGDKYPRKKLIESILEPSKSTVAGYSLNEVTTKKGQVHSGIVKGRSESTVELFLATGETIEIPRKEILSDSPSRGSLMPKGLEKNVSVAEFVDLIAYLETLKQPLSDVARRATPREIPTIAKPVRFEPIHLKEQRFQHPNYVTFIPGTGVENPVRFVVVENDPGKAWLVERTKKGVRKTLFIDLKDEITTGQHMGLMGLAFHPEFRKNRKYYLNHHNKENGRFGSDVVERIISKDFRSDS